MRRDSEYARIPVESGHGFPGCYHRSVQTRGKRKRRWLRAIVMAVVTLLAAFYVCSVVALIAVRWVDPPSTMVQTQRRVEAWLAHKALPKRQQWVPLARISPELQHAVVSAEDGRFFQHHGIDWKEVQKVVDQDLEDGHLGTGRFHHHAAIGEEPLFHHQPERGAQGSGVHAGPAGGAGSAEEANSGAVPECDRMGAGSVWSGCGGRSWYGVPAAKVTREQAARLAAVIPSPLRRKPVRMNSYSAEILRRMEQTGW